MKSKKLSPVVIAMLRAKDAPTGDIEPLCAQARRAYHDGLRGRGYAQYAAAALKSLWAEYAGRPVEELTDEDLTLIELVSAWELRAWEQGRSDAETEAEA